MHTGAKQIKDEVEFLYIQESKRLTGQASQGRLSKSSQVKHESFISNENEYDQVHPRLHFFQNLKSLATGKHVSSSQEIK